MSVQRNFIIFLCTAVAALAVLAPYSSTDLGRIESAAPPYAVSQAGFEQMFDDSDMAALRQQASLALTRLQTRTTSAVAAH